MSLKTGRNDPCPCGSGKKFKQCCGNNSGSNVGSGRNVASHAGNTLSPALMSPPVAAAPPRPDPARLLQEGMALHQQGRLDEAASRYRQILQFQPKDANALQLLGTARLQQGAAAEAEPLIGAALAQEPGMAEWWGNYAECARHLGQLGVAEQRVRRAVALKPELLALRIVLTDTLRQLGRLAEAEATLTGRTHAGTANAWHALGNAWLAQPDYLAAARCFRAVLAAQPSHTGAWLNLALALQNLGDVPEAIRVLHHAEGLSPDDPKVQVALAYMYAIHPATAAQGETHARRALALQADLEAGWVNLAVALSQQGRLLEARDAAQQALQRNPASAEALNLVASTALEMGDAAEAVQAYHDLMQQHPGFAAPAHNYLLALNYLPLAPAEGLAAHQRWGETQPNPAPLYGPPAQPGGRRRIGYVSADLRDHAVAWFIEPVLAHHDPAQFEVFVYASLSASDATTARLKSLPVVWRDIKGLDDARSAALIAADSLDILIDLGGHTNGNRLCVFAYRPAPVQATWLGYLNTTGLPAMDWRIADALSDPPGAEAWQSEKLARLPGSQWCYAPPTDAPDPGPLPALARGYITFACFAFGKAHPSLRVLWARILAAVPDSVLLLVAKDGQALSERMAPVLAAHGIAPHRLRIEGQRSFADYLALHREVDLVLDSWPYNGATTTCHALWMGVPVISLNADWPPAGRSGASLLSAIGLHELACQDPETYLATATRLARDPARLASLRAELRDRMRTGPLTDGLRFTRQLEALLLTLLPPANPH